MRDVKTYQIAAFVGVILSLESDETDETAVQVLTREASAVFYYQAGRWEPTDKTLFNMEPKEATTRFDKQFKELSKTNEA